MGSGRRNVRSRMRMSPKMRTGNRIDGIFMQIKRSWYELYRALNK